MLWLSSRPKWPVQPDTKKASMTSLTTSDRGQSSLEANLRASYNSTLMFCITALNVVEVFEEFIFSAFSAAQMLMAEDFGAEFSPVNISTILHFEKTKRPHKIQSRSVDADLSLLDAEIYTRVLTWVERFFTLRSLRHSLYFGKWRRRLLMQLNIHATSKPAKIWMEN